MKIDNVHTVSADKRQSRVYVWPRGETILDNLQNRRQRPVKIFKAAARAALEARGCDMSRLSLRWSQKAGCSCGCSPGVIVDGWDVNIAGKDLHCDLVQA